MRIKVGRCLMVWGKRWECDCAPVQYANQSWQVFDGLG